MTTLSADAAAEALKAAAFTVTDPDMSDHGRTLVHCFMGGFGADWDLEAALAVLPEADLIEWRRNLMRHDLTVWDKAGKCFSFDVEWPDRDKPATDEIAKAAMPEVEASDVMSTAEEAELVAAVSGGHDPADYVEVTRPEPATTTTHVEYSVHFPYPETDGREAWDYSEPMGDRVDADTYLAYVLERKGRGTLVSRTVTVSNWQDAASSDEEPVTLLRSDGTLTRHAAELLAQGGRIVPADASVLTGPTGAAICGAEDEYVRVRVNGAAPGEPEWADMHLSPARARDLFVQLADALDAIVLEQPEDDAEEDHGITVDGSMVKALKWCSSCCTNGYGYLLPAEAKDRAAHLATAAAIAEDAEKNTPA